MALDVSLLVLTHIIDNNLLELTQKCIESIRGKGDEIIMFDAGSTIGYEPEGIKIIRLKEDPGVIKCINMGIDACKGKHIIFISNDTELVSGDFKDMCLDGLAFPKVIWTPCDYTSDEWHGGFYGFPNKKFYKHSEDYNYYYTDIDLFERAKIKKIPFYRVESVVIKHRVNSTTNKTGGRKKWYDVDKEIFRSKYGYAPE